MSATRRFFGWLRMAIRGDAILIDYYPDTARMSYTTRMHICRISTAQAYSMGYIRGFKILDGWKYLPFKTYVKFNGGKPVAFPTETIDDDGKPYTVLETSSTLFDRYKSKSTEKFVRGMTKTSLTLGDQRKLILIAVVGLVAVAGMALLFMR